MSHIRSSADLPYDSGGKDKRSVCCKRLTNVAIFVLVFVGLFAVLVWDMRKVHMLSEIIHDDHSNHWMQVDNAALKWWLSPSDICMLNVSDPRTDLYAYKAKNCSGLSNSKGSASLHLSCSIGASIGGKICHAPLATRTFFAAQLRNPVIGNATNLLLRTTLRQLAAQRKPVVFVGDGISKQNQEALLCEIMRTDSVALSGTTSAIEGNYTIKWRHDRSLQLEVHYMKLTNMYDNGENEGLATVSEAAAPPPNGKRLRRKAAVTVASDQYNDTQWQHRLQRQNSTRRPHPAKPIKVPLSLTLDSIKERVNGLLERNTNGVVLIVNVGVWYNSRELFRKELPDLLAWMSVLSEEKNSTVLFRETAAQHWNHTSSGYFNLDYIQNRYDNGTCTPVADATPGE